MVSLSHQNQEAYFSVDVETDGPIPGPYSMLSFALVYIGTSDGKVLNPSNLDFFYTELCPISNQWEEEALGVNGLDRNRLLKEGDKPEKVMDEAFSWVQENSGDHRPILVSYPLGFDWMWLYWYFMRFSSQGSPFTHSSGFDLKTAFSVKAQRPISESSRKKLPQELKSNLEHTHHALDDAKEQADIFVNLFNWKSHGSL